MMDDQQTHPIVGAGIGTIAMALAAADYQHPTEEWIHLIPSGEFSGRDGRGPWRVSNADAVIAASLAYAGGKHIPVDYDHQIDMVIKNGQPALAAGWIRRLESRADGIWGFVEWTAKACAHLDAKEYRYQSPVFNFTPNGEVTRFLRVALTNNPALELTALASAQVSDTLAPDPLVELRSLLGLAGDADMTAITEAVRNLTASACSVKLDMSQLVPIERYQAALLSTQALQQQAEETAIAAVVDMAIQQAYLLPHHREMALALCRTDKNQYDQYVASISPLLKGVRGMQTRGLPPEQRGAESYTPPLDETAKAICQAMGHTQEEFINLGATHAD
jgi:phage I-like protein